MEITMRLRNAITALATVIGLSGSFVTQAVAQTQTIAPPHNGIVRVDHLFITLLKMPNGSTLEQVVDLFEGPVVMLKCYTVDTCLKARQIAEPLANFVIDGLLNIAIIEAVGEDKTSSRDIVYMFGTKNCLDMGASEYTTTGLLEAAVKFAESLPAECKQ
jgi:hypothetical protein